MIVTAPKEPNGKLMSLKTVSVAEAATSRLRETLFSGEFAAGEEIKDTHIATLYGIARPTARIAVQQLINEGMLVRKTGHSARVRTFYPEEVRDLYRVRKLIELDSIREIKKHQKPLNLVTDSLEAFHAIPRGREEWASLAAADAAFHSSVVNSASSPRLQTYFSGISSEIRLVIALLKAQYLNDASLYKEHAALYRILSDDTASLEELEQAWTEHLDSAQNFLEQHLASP